MGSDPTPTPVGVSDGTTAGLTAPQAAHELRLALAAADLPLRERVCRLNAIGLRKPSWKGKVKSACKKLKAGINKQKYDLFYDVALLVAWCAEGGPPSSMGVPELRRKLLVSLRVHTLARSSDLAQCVPALWEHQGRFYLRFLDKNFRNRLLVISGRTLTLFLNYLKYVCTAPSPFLFRHLTNPAKALGADALSRMVLQVMTEVGIDTHVFKAHSLRGAGATAFMARGVSQALTRQRGGWGPSQSFEQHYCRLHQQVDWEGVLTQALRGPQAKQDEDSQDVVLEGVRYHLTGPAPGPAAPHSSLVPAEGGDPSGELPEVASVGAECSQPSSPQPEPTKEGEGRGDKGSEHEALHHLNLLCHPLFHGKIAMEDESILYLASDTFKLNLGAGGGGGHAH